MCLYTEVLFCSHMTDCRADPKEAMKKMKETLESIDLQPLQKAHPKPKLDKIELGGKSSKRDSSKPLECVSTAPMYWI